MTDYHENWESLTPEARDDHRALASLREEIEAVDWYHQREALCKNEELRRILVHNRDEEMEHASMILEWLRRRHPAWDETLRSYLFTSAPIVEIEAEETGDGSHAAAAPTGRGTDLGIGGLEHE